LGERLASVRKKPWKGKGPGRKNGESSRGFTRGGKKKVVQDLLYFLAGSEEVLCEKEGNRVSKKSRKKGLRRMLLRKTLGPPGKEGKGRYNGRKGKTPNGLSSF